MNRSKKRIQRNFQKDFGHMAEAVKDIIRQAGGTPVDICKITPGMRVYYRRNGVDVGAVVLEVWEKKAKISIKYWSEDFEVTTAMLYNLRPNFQS